MRAGLSKRQAVLSLWIISAFYGFIALAISNAPYNLENFIVAVAAVVWVISFFLFLKTASGPS
jgi:hypothetical protein